MKSLPGWTTVTERLSAGVLKVTLIDVYGRKVEVTGPVSDETIERAISDAFDIEIQVSKNWSLFLYDLCLLKLAGTAIISQDYVYESPDSWMIELQDKQLVYEGKNACLILQTKLGTDWDDERTLKKKGLSYSSFAALMGYLIKTADRNLPKAKRAWWLKLFSAVKS